MVNSATTSNFDIFISYETTTGADLVLNLKAALKKINFNSFVACSTYDIPPGVDEKKYRYDIIKKTKYFLCIITSVALDSSEIKLEIEKALEYDKEIIISLDIRVNSNKFEMHFPNIKNKQRVSPFTNKNELAREITEYFSDIKLRDKAEVFQIEEIINKKYEEGLIVKPKWSLNQLSENNKMGHIIFNIINKTNKKVLLYGYRMFRITPDGEKDLYYYRKLANADEVTNQWSTNPSFRIIMWANDEHTYNWNDVDIMEVYGFNHIGKWGTELEIGYIDLESKELLISSGNTYIDVK